MSAKRYESRGATGPRHHRRTTRLHQLVSIAALLLTFLFVTTPVRAQSALDGFNPNANGTVRVVVVQPDGKILIGGEFTALSPNGGAMVTRHHIARLNSDGTVDTAFNPNANGDVYTIALQGDGRILVGGYFNGANSIGGQTRNRIARLEATTGAADSWDPNANDYVWSIVVQADGKILAGGYFHGANCIGGQTRNFIARLDPTTGAADSWDASANGFVFAIAVQADGRILAGGTFAGANSIGGQPRNCIARLNATTGLADSFDPSPDSFVFSIAVQADGKILVGGKFGAIGGQVRNRIARLDPTTGSADSFDPNATQSNAGYNSGISAIAVQADGKILVGGFFTNIGGQPRNNIARLDATTGLADSFNPGAEWSINSIAVQADGKILAGGFSFAIGGQIRSRIFRVETDGKLDQTLDPSVNGNTVDAISVQPDGKILIGGDFNSVTGTRRSNIARLNTDGTLDTGFNPPYLASRVKAIALQADGKILVGGDFFPSNSVVNGFITRLDPTTGSEDKSFHPTTNNFVNAIAVQADGKILIGGGFSGQGQGLSRLNPDGAVDGAFNPNVNGLVDSIAVQADSKILAGGNFTSIGGQTRNRLGRVNPDGTLDPAFDPNPNGFVDSIAVQADGKILAGGTFFGANSIGGQTRNRIARLDATTGAADSFDPNASNTVNAISVQADGRILVGGEFSGANSIGGQTRNFIARLDATTGLADSFDPNSISSVLSIALETDGKILVGGFFRTIGGQARNIFARLSNDAAALQNLTVSQKAITWTRSGSSPQFARVTFESSTDNVNYTSLGEGTAAGNNWTLTGLNLPARQNLYIRARGYYRSGYQNSSESIAESVRNAFVIPPTFGNISTRVRVETGDNAMIGGFIITGPEPKTVIVRGLRPSLSIPGALADPIIEVHGNSGELLATNDNWRDGLYAQQVASTLPPANDLESALYGRINPGTYTVVVRGKNDGTGVGVFEVYDLEPTADSKLANVSTRGLVKTGDDVLIGGVIVRGQDPLRVIVRAIGPSLPVPGALADPTLELHDGNGALLVANDNWRSDQQAEIIATTIPPSNDLESAIVRDLTPGNYTAIVRGVNNTTGIAVVEAYGLN